MRSVTKTNRMAGSLLAPIFIHGGMDAFRNPESKVKKADAVVRPLSSVLSFMPDDPALMVQVNGAVQAGAGALLALGRVPRLAAMVLAGSLVPTTYAGHAYWKEIDREVRLREQTHFLKNVALLGGLLLMAFERGHGTRSGTGRRHTFHRTPRTSSH